GAGLQEQETVDVILEATLRAGEVVGFAGHPFLQAVEQCLTDLLAALRATRLAGKALGRHIDAAPGNDLQAIERPAIRQAFRLLDDVPRPRRDGVSHAARTSAATGARQRLDDIASDQPAQHRPGSGLMSGKAGYAGNEYQRGRHGRSRQRKSAGSLGPRLCKSS